MPLTIQLPDLNDIWDERTSSFVSIKGTRLTVEHSLISISKWESKWKKPFFSEVEKTNEETLDYIKCMTINKVDDIVYNFITPEIAEQISNYISDPMTATTFSNIGDNKPSREVITAEILYYDMIMYGIPPEYSKWHINKLITLIRVCSIKNGGEKKMSSYEAGRFQRSINEKRRLAARHK